MKSGNKMTEEDRPTIKFKRKIVENAGVTRITIPKEITNALKIEQGEFWEVYAQDNNTIIVKRIIE